MRRKRFGRIINIASINGHKGQFGQSNYSASKAGITGFSKALALEEARNGITVNCVAPGYCATDMVAAVPHHGRDACRQWRPVHEPSMLSH
jgi:acetoacetyl-CoA reductase